MLEKQVQEAKLACLVTFLVAFAASIGCCIAFSRVSRIQVENDAYEKRLSDFENTVDKLEARVKELELELIPASTIPSFRKPEWYEGQPDLAQIVETTMATGKPYP